MKENATLLSIKHTLDIHTHSSTQEMHFTYVRTNKHTKGNTTTNHRKGDPAFKEAKRLA